MAPLSSPGPDVTSAAGVPQVADIAGERLAREDPDLGEVIVTEEEIRDKIRELGARITADYAGRPPLLVGVLKGAFVFMSDLSRAIALPVEFDFMAVASYGSSTRTSGVVRIVKDLDTRPCRPSRPGRGGHCRFGADPCFSAAQPCRSATCEPCGLRVARQRRRSHRARAFLHRVPHPEGLRSRLRA